MNSSSESDEEFFDFEETITLKYYAVALPVGKGTNGFVFTSMHDAQKKLKEFPGSRMKIFYNPNRAEEFCSKPLIPMPKATSENQPNRLPRDLCQFPSVSQRDLNVLKLAIERGQLERMNEIISNNPRHLVTDSDSPTIFQVRFRYNAFHIATFHGKLEPIVIILEKLRDCDFVSSLYPSVDEGAQLERQRRLIDMYLNAPEIGYLETPLHFACKFSHVNCVRELVKQPEINLFAVNLSNATAEKVIGSRWAGSSEEGEARRQEILLLLHQTFVILKQCCENGSLVYRVCDPITFHGLQDLLCKQDINDPIVLAYAGPMMPATADKFCEEWRSPTRLPASVREQLRTARRVDADKGLERTGRYLARSYDVEWKEYWHFMKDYLDFASPGGLQRLEEHLSGIANSVEQVNVENLTSAWTSSAFMEAELPIESIQNDQNVTSNARVLDNSNHSSPAKEHSKSHSLSLSFNMTQLSTIFSRMRLWDSPPAPGSSKNPAPSSNINEATNSKNGKKGKIVKVDQDMPISAPLFASSPQSSKSNMFVPTTSTPKAPNLSHSTSKKMPPRMNCSVSLPNDSYIQRRTKDDLQVYVAMRSLISQYPNELDSFPRVRAWKEEMDFLSLSDVNSTIDSLL